ncbi:MAG: putative toxin-antitoxin system toxin component, PIN family [Coriobacteriia bacterium]
MVAPRVFIDTNVLVSAVLFGGPPAAVVDAARTGALHAAVSLHVLGEFRDVLARPRFGVEPEVADMLAEEIASFCEVMPIERSQARWGPDPDDDPVIEAALMFRATAIVTGDAHLLGVRVSGLVTLTPAPAVERWSLQR